jgi:shikimate dehydrogenase
MMLKKAFIVGHPVAHSRSPLIHGFWLEQLGLAGSYERVDIAPSDFVRFLETFREQGFVGGNVTIPHKESAYANAQRRTARAERLKAVNTVWIEDGVLWGDNTDVLGFMAHLDRSLGDDWERTLDTALILGAGGAARAVVAGLLDRPIRRLSIANRTPGRAEDLVKDLGFASDPRVSVLPLGEVDAVLPDTRIVVNTTSLGMTGHPPLAIDLARAPTDAAVADIVYVPLETPLLAAARMRGLRVVDGLGMLLHQAAPGFSRWFGAMPAVTPALREVVAADIEGRGRSAAKRSDEGLLA